MPREAQQARDKIQGRSGSDKGPSAWSPHPGQGAGAQGPGFLLLLVHGHTQAEGPCLVGSGGEEISLPNWGIKALENE